KLVIRERGFTNDDLFPQLFRTCEIPAREICVTQITDDSSIVRLRIVSKFQMLNRALDISLRQKKSPQTRMLARVLRPIFNHRWQKRLRFQSTLRSAR